MSKKLYARILLTKKIIIYIISEKDKKRQKKYVLFCKLRRNFYVKDYKKTSTKCFERKY